MPRKKLKKASELKPKGFAMNPGSKNIDSPGVFSLNDTDIISSLNTEPKLKKEGKAKITTSTSDNVTTTTTKQRVAGAGKKGGFTSGTGYDLDEVIVGLDTKSSSKANKPKRKEHIVYKTGAGKLLADINPFSRRKTYGGAKVRRVRR